MGKFLHPQKADENLNKQLKFQVNRCMYADTVMHDAQLCQKHYNSPDRFVRARFSHYRLIDHAELHRALGFQIWFQTSNLNIKRTVRAIALIF